MLIGICDDNKQEHSSFVQLCDRHGTHSYLHYYNGKELLCADRLPELLFLDIEMPGLNGVDVMRKFELLSASPYIIFYTSHVEYMPDAYGKKVIGFLRKPISDRDIEKYLVRAHHLLSMEGFITINHKKIYYKDIIYIESSRNYTIIHCMKKSASVSKTIMAEWASSLPASFSYIHRSYIVNFHYVSKIGKNHVLLEHAEIEKLPVSRRRRKEVAQEYDAFLCCHS